MNIKTIKIFGIGIIVGIGILAVLSFTEKISDAPFQTKSDGRIQYNWYPPELPKQMSFAGEKVPLSRMEIKESLDREMIINVYGHSNTMYILKLANRVFPVIERKLKENGIPDDFKYLCAAESSLGNPISKAGAVGYWQFMTATAKQFNLEVNSEVDERYDLEKSTDAACKYLKAAYNKFGNWTAAAASYNCGMGGYNSQQTFQNSSDYYDLYLPEETNRYIFRILALKEIIGKPAKYGYFIPESDAYVPLKARPIVVSNSISNLSTFAKDNGTNYKMIRILNPWLRGRSLTISKNNSYTILLPK